MKTEHLKDFIETVWNQGNTETIDRFIQLDYTIHHDPNDPWEGMTLDQAGFKNRVEQSRAPIPDQKFAIQSAFENSESVCITWLWEGMHKGSIAGFEPTGKKINMSGSTVYFYKNGLINGHWQVADRLAIYQQLQNNRAE